MRAPVELSRVMLKLLDSELSYMILQMKEQKETSWFHPIEND